MQPLAADDPRTIGAYRLLRRLGAGGMGRVYLGRSPGGRTVAVKVVHAHFAADEQFRARFRLEIEAGRRVGGDWTAPVLDADPEADTPWVATGYVAGPSLQQAVEAQGALPEQSVRALGAGLAEALTAVHGLELVHRDVKPSNVLLTLDGPRLIDFGIARATDATASLTATGVSIGSPGFMSPEQVLGRGTDRATDVFSTGAVLAFAATGQPPFPGDSSATLLYKVVHEEPELHGLRGELRELVAAALAKEAADRPTSQELAERLSGGVGAAALIVPGWLPGPVVEGVSRRAVELLELETEPESRPAPEDPATTPLGTFGPPAYATPTGPSAPYGTPPGGQGQAPVPPYAQRTPPPRNKLIRRRGRTSLIVLVALAAAALLTDSFLIGGNDGNGGGTNGAVAGAIAGGDSGGSGSNEGGNDGKSSGETDGTADADQLDSVPDDFVGTWRGNVSSQGGNRIQLTVTVKAGAKGERLVNTLHRVDASDTVQCKGVGQVDRITKSTLAMTEHADGKPPEVLGVPMCSAGPSKSELTLDDGTLTYESQDDASGRPKGELEMDGD